MAEPKRLWTTYDIASELGINGTTVCNWVYYDRDFMPEPIAITVGGIKLWSDRQAGQIMDSYEAAQEQKRLKVQEKARESRAKAWA